MLGLNHQPYKIVVHDCYSLGIAIANKRDLSADIITDHYLGSESYWRHEQDISADMLRQMRIRCEDPREEVLYNYVHLLGQERPLWAPNYFITIAPARRDQNNGYL